MVSREPQFKNNYNSAGGFGNNSNPDKLNFLAESFLIKYFVSYSLNGV